ncbi:MAG TPA: hypothetical protein VGC16_03545 [Rhizomicrobium sp.]
MMILGFGAGIAAAETVPPQPAGRATATMGVSVTVVEPSRPPTAPPPGK